MMDISKLFLINFCLFYFGYIAVIIGNKIGAPIKLTNLKCDVVNSEWFGNVTCKIKAHSRIKRTAEIQGYLLQPLHQFTAKVNILKRYSGWKPWVFPSITVDACEFLAGKHHVILNIVKHMIKKNTSLNHTCPYLPGIIEIRNWDLSEMSLSTLIIPSGQYRVDIELYTNRQIRLILLNFFAEVWEI